jgi:hypothetical protein
VPNTQVRRSFAALASAVLAAACVTGCGGDNKDQPGSSSSSPVGSPPATALASATAPGDISTTTTTTALPVPTDGPTAVASFPVPKGVKVKGPGPQAQSWQFDITTRHTDSVLAFYRKALAEGGYEVHNNVNVKVGVEKVHYDIQFGGPAKGYIVADPTENDVFVLVESRPTS